MVAGMNPQLGQRRGLSSARAEAHGAVDASVPSLTFAICAADFIECVQRATFAGEDVFGVSLSGAKVVVDRGLQIIDAGVAAAGLYRDLPDRAAPPANA